MLCQKCYGSGKVMGLGMIYEDCPCDEQNDDELQNEKKNIQIDKRSKEYRDAIKKIVSESNVNKVEAEKLFESEFYKIA
jgi:hypothetical protein